MRESSCKRSEKYDQQGVPHNDGKYFAYISLMDNEIKRGESGKSSAHASQSISTSRQPASLRNHRQKASIVVFASASSRRTIQNA